MKSNGVSELVVFLKPRGVVSSSLTGVWEPLPAGGTSVMRSGPVVVQSAQTDLTGEYLDEFSARIQSELKELRDSDLRLQQRVLRYGEDVTANFDRVGFAMDQLGRPPDTPSGE